GVKVYPGKKSKQTLCNSTNQTTPSKTQPRTALRSASIAPLRLNGAYRRLHQCPSVSPYRAILAPFRGNPPCCLRFLLFKIRAHLCPSVVEFRLRLPRSSDYIRVNPTKSDPHFNSHEHRNPNPPTSAQPNS